MKHALRVLDLFTIFMEELQYNSGQMDSFLVMYLDLAEILLG
jgi:hypothetical protein